MTLTELAHTADAISMDLRGLSKVNRGCIFEIEHMVRAVPLQRVVLLVDDSTDIGLLKQTLQAAWASLPADSPNA